MKTTAIPPPPPSIIRSVGSHIRQYGLRALAPEVLQQLRATLTEALAVPGARDTRLGKHLARKLAIELARRPR